MTEKFDSSKQFNKENNPEVEKEKRRQKIEANELYKKIMYEMDKVIIGPENKDKEGNLLAPNGKKSNLLEKEWKMTRTSSFKEWFGDWEKKYENGDYDYWTKFLLKKELEDNLLFTQYYIEEQRKTINRYEKEGETVPWLYIQTKSDQTMILRKEKYHISKLDQELKKDILEFFDLYLHVLQ